MSTTSFPVLADRFAGYQVAAPYAPGQGTLALASAPPLAIPPGGFARLTITTGIPPGETFVTHLKATGIAGSTFTGVSAMDGFADVAITAGAFASIRCSAELLNAMATAINGIESTGANAPPSGVLKGAGGAFAAAVPGTDYVVPSGSIAGSAGTITGSIAESQVTGLVSDLAAIDAELGTLAPLASPALTGTPTAPTATAGTSTTQVATTAFVGSAIGAYTPPVTSVFGRTGAVALEASDLPTTGVTATTYTNATFSVGSDGRITTAENGPTLGAAATKGVAGNGADLVAFDGGTAPTAGHLATWDASGGLVDGGAVPSGGGGSLAIGSSIGGAAATAGALLTTNGSGDLAQDTGVLASGGQLTLTGLVSTASGGAACLANTTAGSGLVLEGTDGTNTCSLRIVTNSSGWADGVETSYIQVNDSGGAHNVTWLSGGYGTDAAANRQQFCAAHTQISSYGTGNAFNQTPVPTATAEVVTGGAVALKVLSPATPATSDLVQHVVGASVLSGVNAAGQHYLATTAGAPTGTPAVGTIVFDSTDVKLWVHVGSGTWKGVALA
jgi:hypothetical protein